MNTITKVCSISEMPYESRPANRLSNYGVQALTIPELFSVVTGSKDLISYNLQDIMNLEPSELKNLGLSKSTSMKIAALVELSKRIFKENISNEPVFNSPETIANHVKAEMMFEEREQLRLLCFNIHRNLISEQILTRGTVDSSLVSVREVIISALRNNACSIALCHNHPSGSEASPSDADIDVTNKISSACTTTGIKFMDHIIISQSGYFSFKERGMI